MPMNTSKGRSNHRPIITVKEARRLLGKDSKGLDDIEVIELINDLHEIAKYKLKKKSVKKSNNSIGLQ